VLGHGHFCGICPLTAETICETMKCVSDVAMPARRRMGSKREIFRFFKSGYAHDRNFSIFGRRASTVTGNTLIKPNYAGVRQSRDSLHRDRHKVTKKVAAAPCSETASANKLEKFTETCFYPRDAMLARVFATATCLSVRLSVCPSVCLSHAGIVPSRAKAGS